MSAIAFDVEAAHAHFSKACFNAARALIEKPDRTPAEGEEMIRLNQASLWHWTQRPDCTDPEERDLVLADLATLPLR